MSERSRFEELLERILGLTEKLDESSNLKLKNYSFLFLNRIISSKLFHKCTEEVVYCLFDSIIVQYLPNYELLLNNKLEEAIKLSSTRLEKCEDKSKKAYLKLKSRWLFTTIRNFMEFVLSNKFEAIIETKKEAFFMYSESFLYFLILCVSQPILSDNVLILLKKLRFSSIFYKYEHSFKKINEYVKILNYFIYYSEHFDDQKFFYSLQKEFYSSFPEKNGVESFAFSSSMNDYTPILLKEFLSKFNKDELIFIARNLGLISHIPPQFIELRFVLEIISNMTFLKYYINRQLKEFACINSFTETELFDDFTENFESLSTFQPLPLFPLDNVTYLDLQDYIHRSTSQLKYCFQKDIHKHINTVLERVKFSIDSFDNLKIKGSSKYLSHIDTHSLVNPIQSELIVGNKEMTLNETDSIILIELTKPNKYSPFQRIQKFGLTLARICKISETTSNNKMKKILVTWNKPINSEFVERFSHVICLSDNIIRTECLNYIRSMQKIELPSFFENLFLGSRDANLENQLKIPFKLKIHGITLDALKETYSIVNESQPMKKQKINKSTFLSSMSHFLNFDEDQSVFVQSIYEPQSLLLDSSQSKALISSFSSRVTIVESSPHSGIHVLLNCILSNLYSNFKDERTLIVVPNITFLNKYQVPPEISRKSLKFELHHSQNQLKVLSDRTEELLRRVEILAETIGLKNFGFNQTCEDAILLYKNHIKLRWTQFLENLRNNKDKIDTYPFDPTLDLSGSFKENINRVYKSYKTIVDIFKELNELGPLMKFQKNKNDQINYMVKKLSRFILVTPEILIKHQEIYSLKYDTVIFIDYRGPSLFQLLPLINNLNLKRLVLFNDPIFNTESSSLFSRFKYLNLPRIQINQIRNVRTEFIDLFKSSYGPLQIHRPVFREFNPGFTHICQIIEIEDSEPYPKVSVAEAEYAVLLYQYMEILGYPVNEIGLVVYSPYQKALILELLSKTFRTNVSDTTHNSNTDYPSVDLIGDAMSHKWIITSLYGSTTNQIEKTFTLPREGLYMIGISSVNPWSIFSGNLQICKHENYDTETRAADYGMFSYDDISNFIKLHQNGSAD